MKKTRIGIVGVGPRGLTLIERLVANERARPSGPMEIVVFDPNAPGPGCHDPAQSDIHLVNTVAGQLTLFADASVVDAGPVMAGPSFHQWLAQQDALGAGALPAGERPSADGYYPRGLFGRYLQWVFRYVCALAPPSLEIVVRRSAVLRADRDDDAWVLQTAEAKIRVDYLFLTTGHTKPAPRREQAPSPCATLVVDDPYPVRASLAAIRPGMTVAVEGMGLTSFDVVAELTVGRGGRFVADAAAPAGLRYLRSGHEPRLAVFSRSGLPLGARAVNQKGVSSQYRARFLQLHRVREMRAARRLDFAADVMPLLLADMEHAWYDAWFRQHADAEAAAMFAGFDAPRRAAWIRGAVPDAERFSWQRLAAPVPHPALDGRDAFGGWLRAHLADDVAEARHGNLGSPVKAACDVLRDLRDNLRAAIEFGGLTEGSHRWVLAEFMPVMNRLAVGPPASRIAEMLALMDAGVLEADFGPGARCRAPDGGGFMRLCAAAWPDHGVKLHALVKARISMHGPQDDASPLLRGLLADGYVRPYRNGEFHPGGIEVDRQHRWVGRGGQAAHNAWALGIPTEGVKWCTFVVPRPGVNSTAIVDAGRAVTAMLAMIRGDAPASEPSGTRDAPAAQRLLTEAEASRFASLHGAL